MNATAEQRVKVLSVVGAGRSGTTVLASILGEVDGFVGAGELRWLWERGVVGGRPCGCGAAPLECPVWAPVITRTLGGLGRAATAEGVVDVVAAQHEVADWRHYPRLLRSVDGDDRGWGALRLVRAVTGAACAALAGTTGARVLVDTSKRPADTAVLAGIPGVDLYVLHLVRDPRAVVHSWRRAKEYTAGGRTGTIGTRGLAGTVRRWTSNGLSAEALRRRLPASRWLFLRYEDFVAGPAPAVERILAHLHEPGPAPFTDDQTVALHPNHIVAGNPSRFVTGSVAISADDEWRRAMSGRDQRLVGLMTLPLALRYGYPPFVRGGGAR
ncbi:MAG TPA: sulfotransferase [Nocardioidaceae bacterium]|nr:sulfotransferase [Nocardioidaceae bacterium]